MFFTVIYKNDMIKYLVLIGWGVAIRLFVWGGGGGGIGGGQLAIVRDPVIDKIFYIVLPKMGSKKCISSWPGDYQLYIYIIETTDR